MFLKIFLNFGDSRDCYENNSYMKTCTLCVKLQNLYIYRFIIQKNFLYFSANPVFAIKVIYEYSAEQNFLRNGTIKFVPKLQKNRKCFFRKHLFIENKIKQPRAATSQRLLVENVRDIAPIITKLEHKIATYQMAWKAQSKNENY